MPVVNEGLEQELAYVTKPTEHKHIREQWDDAAPILQDISYNLIVGANTEVADVVQKPACLGEFDIGTQL